MVKIKQELNSNLLTQPFPPFPLSQSQLEQGRRVAMTYSKLENCISVLSDLIARRSYIYNGAIAKELGFDQPELVIDSIWEDELLKLMNPEDLQIKYRTELQFFRFLQAVDLKDRANYEVITRIRTRGRDGQVIVLKHRLLYLNDMNEDCQWLTLCLYQKIPDHPAYSIPNGVIFNKVTGEIIDCSPANFDGLLSLREKEILNHMKSGFRSKEIAEKLSLSIHTINRHRQNIFKKLNVANVMEACRVADGAGLL